MKNLRVAFIGGGNMASAMIGALLRSGVRAEGITVGESDAAQRTRLAAEFGVTVTDDNAAAVRSAALVVLAVKPQQMEAVLLPLRPALQSTKPIVLSIAAGVRIASLQHWCGAGIAVLRAMPNRPALVGAGASGVYAGIAITAAQRELATTPLKAAGSVIWVESEDLLDAVTALSGSGPAYFFLLAEALTAAGVQLGLTNDAARQLSIATLNGAGIMALQSDGDLARLRAEVTSKGGTTEAALAVFESAGLRDIVSRALKAAALRSDELSRQFGTRPN